MGTDVLVQPDVVQPEGRFLPGPLRRTLGNVAVADYGQARGHVRVRQRARGLREEASTAAVRGGAIVGAGVPIQRSHSCDAPAVRQSSRIRRSARRIGVSSGVRARYRHRRRRDGDGAGGRVGVTGDGVEGEAGDGQGRASFDRAAQVGRQGESRGGVDEKRRKQPTSRRLDRRERAERDDGGDGAARDDGRRGSACRGGEGSRQRRPDDAQTRPEHQIERLGE